MKKTQKETFSQPNVQKTESDAREVVLYGTSLQNKLKNIREGNIFKTVEHPERGWLWTRKHIETLGGTKTETENKLIDLTDNIQKAFIGTTRKSVSSLSVTVKVTFLDMLQTTFYFNQHPKQKHP